MKSKTRPIDPFSGHDRRSAHHRLIQAGVIRLALFLPQDTKDAATGAVRGLGPGVVMLDIAREFAARLDTKLLIVEQPTPRAALDCIRAGGCEFASLGFEPSRAAEIEFTPAVSSSITVFWCRPTQRCAIRRRRPRRNSHRRGAQSRLHHGAHQHDQTCRVLGFDLPDDTFNALRDGKAEAFAAPRQILVEYSERLPGSRVLDQGDGVNRVGIAVAKHRPGLHSYSEYVEDVKASGLIGRLIAEAGLRGFASRVFDPPQPRRCRPRSGTTSDYSPIASSVRRSAD